MGLFKSPDLDQAKTQPHSDGHDKHVHGSGPDRPAGDDSGEDDLQRHHQDREQRQLVLLHAAPSVNTKRSANIRISESF